MAISVYAGWVGGRVDGKVESIGGGSEDEQWLCTMKKKEVTVGDDKEACHHVIISHSVK